MKKQYKLKTPKVVENTVIKTYQNIENSVVGTYKKIENKFVDTFLEEANNPEEAEKRQQSAFSV